MVRAFDHAGNSSNAVLVSVTVALPLHFNDLSRQTYLRDLIDFTSLRLRTGPTDFANITAGHLGEAFHTDFAAMATTSPAAAGISVHLLRLVVPTLFDYIRHPGGVAPIAHWPLNETTQGRDLAAKGNDGRIQGSPAWVLGRTPTSPKALSFDGASTYVQVGRPPLLAVAQQLTLSAWIKPDAAGGDGVIAGKDQQYLLSRFADGTIRFVIATTTSTGTTFDWVNSGVTAPAGQWVHVALVLTGPRVRLYLGGRNRYDAPFVGSAILGSHGGDFRIGGRQSGAASFRGAIADVMVYDRALSAWDVAVSVVPASAQDEVWIDDALPAGSLAEPGEDG